MKIVCAWCGKDLGEKPPLEDKETTHGICEECAAKFKESIGEQKDRQKAS